jgi:hypothetical protein
VDSGAEENSEIDLGKEDRSYGKYRE